MALSILGAPINGADALTLPSSCFAKLALPSSKKSSIVMALTFSALGPVHP